MSNSIDELVKKHIKTVAVAQSPKMVERGSQESIKKDNQSDDVELSSSKASRMSTASIQEQRKEQKFQERLMGALKAREIDYEALVKDDKVKQSRVYEYLIENDELERLRWWEESSLAKVTSSSMGGLEYALRLKKFAAVGVILGVNPYEVAGVSGFTSGMSVMAYEALGKEKQMPGAYLLKEEGNPNSVSVVGKSGVANIAVKNYVFICSLLAKHLDSLQLKQILGKMKKGVPVPTEEQWGKLYLSVGKLEEAVSWSLMHPKVVQNKGFWDHFLKCIENHIILQKKDEQFLGFTGFTGLSGLVKNNINYLSQRNIDYWYKESIRTENEDLFLTLYSSGRSPKDWVLEPNLPGMWAGIRFRTSSLKSSKTGVHVVHYALGIGGTNSLILDWLVSNPQVTKNLCSYKPEGVSLAALDSIEVRKLSKLGVDIEQPLDDNGNRLLHYWVIVDGAYPRSGWGTMLKRYSGLNKPNDAGVTGEQAQRKQLRQSVVKLRDFDLSLVKSQARAIEAGMKKNKEAKVIDENKKKKPKML